METPPLQLPTDTSLLSHQIAGHVYNAQNGRFGVLKHKDGTVLKPLIGAERLKSEHSFYEKIKSDAGKDLLLQELSTLVPKYYGICNIVGSDFTFLKLEDVANSFKVPCNMDVKIGAITYDPNAAIDKQIYEDTKFPEIKKLGFRIIGMRVFDEVAQDFICIEKSFGKKQTCETILDGLHLFLNQDTTCWASIILCLFLHRIKQIENWFLKQNILAFIASSLLFFYEGDRSILCGSGPTINCNTQHSNFSKEKALFCDKSSLTDCMHCLLEMRNTVFSACKCNVCYLDTELCGAITQTGSSTDIRMIDFAHVFPATEVDTNYLFGLQKLQLYLQKLQMKILLQCVKTMQNKT